MKTEPREKHETANAEGTGAQAPAPSSDSKARKRVWGWLAAWLVIVLGFVVVVVRFRPGFGWGPWRFDDPYAYARILMCCLFAMAVAALATAGVTLYNFRKLPLHLKIAGNLPAILMAAGLALMIYIAGPPPSREYFYEMKEAPPMLTEKLAMEKARETMSQEGYNLKLWNLKKIDRSKALRPSKAPDDTPDIYFERDGSTSGEFHFTSAGRKRCVRVKLDWNGVICRVF